MRFTCLALLIVALFQTTDSTNAETIDETTIFEWNVLPELPGPGIGGAFASRIGNRLVLGGGTSFDGTAWYSTKEWSDRILILDPGEENPEWVHSKLVLPASCAYGVSVSLSDGSGLWIGGAGPDGVLDQVLLLDSPDDSLRITRLDPLPFPLAYATGTIIDGVVYLYGGLSDPSASASNVLLSFTPGAPDPEWGELDPLPGDTGHILATAGTHGGSLYIFGGCQLRRSDPDIDDPRRDHRRHVFQGGLALRPESTSRSPLVGSEPAPTCGFGLSFSSGPGGYVLSRTSGWRRWK